MPSSSQVTSGLSGSSSTTAVSPAGGHWYSLNAWTEAWSGLSIQPAGPRRSPLALGRPGSTRLGLASVGVASPVALASLGGSVVSPLANDRRPVRRPGRTRFAGRLGRQGHARPGLGGRLLTGCRGLAGRSAAAVDRAARDQPEPQLGLALDGLDQVWSGCRRGSRPRSVAALGGHLGLGHAGAVDAVVDDRGGLRQPALGDVFLGDQGDAGAALEVEARAAASRCRRRRPGRTSAPRPAKKTIRVRPGRGVLRATSVPFGLVGLVSVRRRGRPSARPNRWRRGRP